VLRVGAGAGRELYHASARDPVWEYVLSEEAALGSLATTEAHVVLVGHSHVALCFSLEEDRLVGEVASAGTERDLSERRWLLNPGSVGQPRDGDPRASWLLLDMERRFAEFRRVPYPVEQTQDELRARRLPESLAARLAQGH
jgi:diadenosine tetraphosphatase ApaH/serine/threonine PP2A family protein phosphatase